MNKVVRMSNERDVGQYMVELLNVDTNECEQTEYFPYDTGMGGNGDQGAAFAKAKKCQLDLAEKHNADRQ